MAERQLDQRVFPYQVTVPAQTSSSGPIAAPVAIDPGTVCAIELQVPSGHVGLTGFSLTLAGTTIFPWGTTGAFIVAENVTIHSALGIEVATGLETLCYNEGFYDHTFFYRLWLAENPPVDVTPFDATPGTALGTGFTGMIVTPAPTFPKV